MVEPFNMARDDSILWIKEWMDKYPNLIAGFTTKFGGVSRVAYESLNLGLHVGDNSEKVIQNRTIVSEKLSFPLESWVLTEQCHGNQVLFVGEEDKGRGAFNSKDALQQADGMLTDTPGVLCVTMYADCVPLFFMDPMTQQVAVVHAGWKGSVREIAKQTIKKFTDHSSNIEDLQVVIGPSICKDCYEVDESVINHIDEKYADAFVEKGNKYLLDLKKLNELILLDAGITSEQIQQTTYCTYEDSLFFSHRRDHQRTGRMIGFIGYRMEE